MLLEDIVTTKREKKKRSSVPKTKTKPEATPWHILLIEDDSDISDMYKVKLEQEGFNVTPAIDGAKGLNLLKTTHPDLVLLDILMPKKDGFDVLEEVNRSKDLKSVPIIILTNLASAVDMEEGKKLGAKDWWLKAYNTPSDIANKVRKFLEESSCYNIPAKQKVVERV